MLVPSPTKAPAASPAAAAPKAFSAPSRAGDVERGEQPHETVVRETLEETGSVVGVRRLVGIYEFPAKPLVSYVFECELLDGEPAVPGGGEIAEVTWYHARDVPEPQTEVLSHATADAASGDYGVVRLRLPLRYGRVL